MQGSSSKFMSWDGQNFIEEDSLAGVYKSGRWNKNSEASSPLRLVKAGLNETRMQISKSCGGILIQLEYSTPHLHLNLLPALYNTCQDEKSNLNCYPLSDDYWSSPDHVKLSQICEWLTCRDSYLTPCVLEQISSATQWGFKCRRVGEAKLCVWE